MVFTQLKNRMMRGQGPATILAYLALVPLASVWLTVGMLWILDKLPLFAVDISLFIDNFVLPLLVIKYAFVTPKLLVELFFGGS